MDRRHNFSHSDYRPTLPRLSAGAGYITASPSLPSFRARTENVQLIVSFRGCGVTNHDGQSQLPFLARTDGERTVIRQSQVAQPIMAET